MEKQEAVVRGPWTGSRRSCRRGRRTAPRTCRSRTFLQLLVLLAMLLDLALGGPQQEERPDLEQYHVVALDEAIRKHFGQQSKDVITAFEIAMYGKVETGRHRPGPYGS